MKRTILFVGCCIALCFTLLETPSSAASLPFLFDNPLPPGIHSPPPQEVTKVITIFCWCPDSGIPSDSNLVLPTYKDSLFDSTWAGSLASYYKEMSLNARTGEVKHHIVGTSVGDISGIYYVRSDSTWNYYKNHGGSAAFEEDIIRKVDPYVDFGSYDWDLDADVDVDCLLFQFAPYVYGDRLDAPSGMYPLIMYDFQTQDMKQGEYVWIRQVRGTQQWLKEETEFIPLKFCIAVTAHEYGHFLGLPDLYDGYNADWAEKQSAGSSLYDRMCGCFTKTPAVKPFEVECSPLGPYCRGTILGWGDFVSVDSILYHRKISDYTTTGEMYRLSYDQGRCFFVTNHQRLGFWERLFPGRGLLLWHVDRDGEGTGMVGDMNEMYKLSDLETASGLRDTSGQNPDHVAGMDNLDFATFLKDGPTRIRDSLYMLNHSGNWGDSTDFWGAPFGTGIFDGLSNPSSNAYNLTSGGWKWPWNDSVLVQNVPTHIAVYNVQRDPADSTAMIADLLVNNWYGHITQNTTWGAPYQRTHYVITGDVTVDSGVTLKILPGTTIDFYPHTNNQNPLPPVLPAGLYVSRKGKLIAKGEAANPIVFQSNAYQLGGYPTSDDWMGIYLGRFSQDTLVWCQIRDCHYGVWADSALSAVIDTNTFTNNGIYGIRITNSFIIKVNRNRILGGTTYGIYLERTNGRFSGNREFKGNYIEMGSYGIYVNSDSMGPNSLILHQDTLIYPYDLGGAMAAIHLERTKGAVRVQRCRIFQGPGGNAGIECMNRVWPLIDSTKMITMVGPSGQRTAYGIYIDTPNSPTSDSVANIRRDSIANFDTGVYAGNVNTNPPRLGINGNTTFLGRNNIVGCGSFYVNYWGIKIPPVLRAENNWWGSNPPDPNKFIGNVDYTPYQTNPVDQPWLCGENGGSGPQGAELLEVLLPTKFDLSQSYPNPANGKLTIQYALPQEAHVSMKVYNVAGQLIRTLVSCPMAAGYHSVHWDGKSDNGHLAGPGVYFYRMDAGTFTSTKKLILAR